MTRIALVGYGQMGKEIERLAEKNGVAVSAVFDSQNPLKQGGTAESDVAIEFTTPDTVLGNIELLLETGTPVVVGTTGWDSEREKVHAMVEERKGRLIYASNFSVGVHLFFRIVREAGRLMEQFDMYDVSLHETHHVRKADSPSGTAISLANIMLEELTRKTHLLKETSHQRIDPAALHVTSQRLGETIGTHTVAFDSEADTIELTHRARNRSGFALGAILAAKWLVGQESGMYRFEDIFETLGTV